VATRNAATTAEINSAYAASSNGDIINLTGTNYAVNGEYTSPVGTKTVTFQGQGRTVTKFGFLIVNSSNSTWKDLAAQSLVSDPYWASPFIRPTGVTIDNVEVHTGYRTETVVSSQTGGNVLYPLPYRGGAFVIEGTTGWTVKNSSLGGIINGKSTQVTGANNTFENCVIHDCYLNNSGRSDAAPATHPLMHLEGMWAASCSGLTLKRCFFYRNNVMDVFFTNLGGAATTDVTIENCLFAHTISATTEAGAATWDPSATGLYIANLGTNVLGSITDWVVRNNTFETQVVCSSRPVVNSRWVGNIGSWPNLSSQGMTYAYNCGTKIAASDTLVSPAVSTAVTPAAFGWVNSQSPVYDFHLTSASVCRDKADPTDYPTVDLDGVTRS
jgi:hypothetical protein